MSIRGISQIFRSKTDREFASAIRNISGITPRNLNLYRSAFTHRSYHGKEADNKVVNNERLEYLGDAVVDLVIADLLYKKYPFKDEGFLTEMRSRAVSSRQHAFLAGKLGLAKLLLYDTNNIRLNGNQSILADVYESFIAAIYLDQGFQTAFHFISTRIVGAYIDFDNLEKNDTNFKSRVFEWAQKNGKQVEFQLVDTLEHGPKKQFVIELVIDGVAKNKGLDYTKKEAEQNACERFLRTEGMID